MVSAMIKAFIRDRVIVSVIERMMITSALLHARGIQGPV